MYIIITYNTAAQSGFVNKVFSAKGGLVTHPFNKKISSISYH